MRSTSLHACIGIAAGYACLEESDVWSYPVTGSARRGWNFCQWLSPCFVFSICCIPMATVRGKKEEVLMHSSLM